MKTQGKAKARRQVKGRAVRRELLPGQSERLLREMHLLTRDGNLNADALRKLKQVNHLVGLLQPALEDLFARYEEPLVVDCGSGKGYLGFVLAELFFEKEGRGKILSIESREDLVRSAKERAERLGFHRMEHVHAEVETAPLLERVHMVLALHACDTATDDALALAIRHRADHVAVVPCCQAELARQLAERKEASPWARLHRHALHRREFGAHLSNVLRALTLEAHGYQVTVTELVGWEHSLKNELILGRRVHAFHRRAQRELAELLEASGVRPKLNRILEKELARDADPT